MSIAEKLTTIAENEQKVYKAGKDKGWLQGYETGYQMGEEDFYPKGVADGKKAEYDEFWDNYQDNGKRTNYQNAFCREGWNDTTFKPKYNMKPTTCNQMFQACEITDLEQALKDSGVTLDTSNSTSFLQMVQSSTITVLPKIDVTKATSLSYAFSVKSLKIIRELVVAETTPFSNTFGSGLEEMIVSGTIGQNGFSAKCPKLNKASITSIINALSTTTSGLSITLSVEAVWDTFGATTEPEWVALVGSRPNWTISLV